MISGSTSSQKPLNHAEGDVSERFSSFQTMLLESFKVNDVSELPFDKIEYAFDIFNGTEDFTFDDEDERLNNFLPLMASLYSCKKREKVFYISPTYYYAQQAARMRDSYIYNLGGSRHDTFPCLVPGMGGFQNSVRKCDIVFMHGKDYSEYLPDEWRGRKIIQIFPDIEVPVDPIKRSYCGMHDNLE